jgi:hypothetical protein
MGADGYKSLTANPFDIPQPNCFNGFGDKGSFATLGLKSEEDVNIKLLICVLAVMSLGMLAACDQETPAYSASERFNQDSENMHLDQEEFNDDVDHFLLLRPSDSLTWWNVYHRN